MKNHKTKRRQVGFTLIELMITVAVIGILAAIALPNYTQYIQRSHRSNARNTLLQAAQWMERAANSTGAYPLNAPAIVPPATVSVSQIPTSLLAVEGSRYTVNMSISTGTAFTFRAVPTTVQTSDPCETLVLDHVNQRSTRNSADTGARTATTPTDAECWQR